MSAQLPETNVVVASTMTVHSSTRKVSVGQEVPAIRLATRASPSISGWSGLPGPLLSVCTAILVARTLLVVRFMPPLTWTFMPTWMAAQEPLSKTVFASTLTRKVPTMNCSVGHEVPATSEVTIPSPSAGSFSFSFSFLNSTFDAVIVRVAVSIMPVTSSVAPTFTSAQAPCSNIVVAVRLTVNELTVNCSVGHAVPAARAVTVPSPSTGCVVGGVVPGGVVGAVGGTPSNSILEAVTVVPTLVPLTSSITPGLMSAHPPPSNLVALVTEIVTLPIMKLSAGQEVPATRDVTGASPSTSSPSLPLSNATTRLVVTAEAVCAATAEGEVTPPA